MSYFLDANVLLEALILGRFRHEEVLGYLSEVPETRISALSVHIGFYFGLKAGFLFADLEELMRRQAIIDLSKQDIEWAYRHHVGDDLEDALQVASAVREGCEVFVTLDAKLARDYGRYIEMKLL